MRILIAEEGIKKTSGHWYAYTDSIRKALIKEGHEVVVAAHQDASDEIINLLQAKRVFRYSRWDGIYNSKFSLVRYYGVFLHNWRLFRDLDGFIKDQGFFDHIFAGNNLIYHVLAWRRFCKKYVGKSFGKLSLLFVQDAGNYHPINNSISFPRHSLLLKKALLSFRKYNKNGSVEFAAETAVTAKQYELFCGVPVRIYNHPTEIDFRKPTPEERNPQKPICFGAFGFARYEKGSDLLQEAAHRFIKQNPEANVKFMLQWNQDFKLPNGSTCSKNTKLAVDSRFSYTQEPLSGDGFTNFLKETDIMVMPYRWSSYYSRLSRVTIESMIAGIPTVYTKGTWLENAIQQSGCGIGFENENVESLVIAMKQAFDQFEELNRKAHAKSRLAEKNYSGSAFAKILFSQ